MLGGAVCLRLFRRWSISHLRTTGTQGQESAVVPYFGLLRSLSLLALCLALSLLSLLISRTAYGEEYATEPFEVVEQIENLDDVQELEEIEGVTVLDENEEWPEDVKPDSFVAKRTDEGFVLAMSDAKGAVSVKSISANPAGAAWELFVGYMKQVLNRQQAFYVMAKDLAWRWYHADATKQAKIPLIPKNDGQYTPLTNATFMSAGDADAQYAKWERYFTQFWPILVLNVYYLNTFEGGGSWSPAGSVNDLTAYQEYAKWYNWFEGITDTPASSTQYPITSPVIMTCVAPYNSKPEMLGTTSELTLTNVDSLNASMNNTGYTYIMIVSTPGSSAGGGSSMSAINRVFFSESPMTVLVTESDVSTESFKTYKYTVTSETNMKGNSYNFSVDCITREGMQNGTTGISSVPSINLGNSYEFTKTQNSPAKYPNCVAVSQNGGAVIQPSEPVYPNYPTQSTPQQPNVTINAPTYNTYTTNENTTTTVDLTPILNAIRILNDNVVTGFDNLSGTLDTHFDNLHRMLEAWFADFSNWLELIYEELQQVNRYLEGIYFNTSGNEEAPIYPDLDDGNSVEQQTDVNLELLKKKFPTSIPWDLYGILTLLETAPVAPSFTLPVVMTEYTITIDLSDFSPMAAVSRRMSVLLFAVGLLMNTKRIASIDIGANHGS